jgi:UDP-glucose 4-epimerase
LARASRLAWIASIILFLEVSGKAIPPQHGLAKLGEQLRSCVDPTLAARALG